MPKLHHKNGETWVPGYDRLYSATPDGRVYSYKNPNGSGRIPDGREPYELVPSNERYRRVMLGGKKQTLHRVIAETFHGLSLGPHYEVRHLDGDAWNNQSNNLAWGTRSDNAQDRRRHGTYPKGTNNANAKMEEHEVREIFLSSDSLKNLAKKYEITESTIQNIKYRRCWRHVTAKLKRPKTQGKHKGPNGQFTTK